MTDEELVNKTVRGDDRAFAEIVRRYLPSVLNHVHRYATVADTERITQDAFYTLWKSIGHFKHGRAFESWLYTVAEEIALNPLHINLTLPVHTKSLMYIRGLTFTEIADLIQKPLNTLQAWRDSTLRPLIGNYLPSGARKYILT